MPTNVVPAIVPAWPMPSMGPYVTVCGTLAGRLGPMPIAQVCTGALFGALIGALVTRTNVTVLVCVWPSRTFVTLAFGESGSTVLITDTATPEIHTLSLLDALSIPGPKEHLLGIPGSP